MLVTDGMVMTVNELHSLKAPSPMLMTAERIERLAERIERLANEVHS